MCRKHYRPNCYMPLLDQITIISAILYYNISDRYVICRYVPQIDYWTAQCTVCTCVVTTVRGHGSSLPGGPGITTQNAFYIRTTERVSRNAVCIWQLYLPDSFTLLLTCIETTTVHCTDSGRMVRKRHNRHNNKKRQNVKKSNQK